MASFKTVLKEHDRMCRSFIGKGCKDCPLGKQRGIFTCLRWIFEHPYESENIIMQWSDEHPPVTNRIKFKEVFGFDAFTDRINVYEWLESEYKEPKDGRSNEN